MNEEEYIQERLDGQISWHSKKSAHSQQLFKRLRVIEIICASIIPLLAGFSANINVFYLNLIIGCLGVIIAIVVAISSLYKLQETWTQFRTTAESLKKEKYLYLTHSKPYSGEQRFELLVNRVEALLVSQTENWASYVVDEKPSAPASTSAP